VTAPGDERDPIAQLIDDPPVRARPTSALRWLAAGVLLLTAVIAASGPGAAAAWETVHDNLDAWQDWAGHNLLAALLIFFTAYAVSASLPLPVLTIMSLLAGCLFGRWLGTGVASLGYVAGVTASFLMARSLLRERLRRQFGPRLRRVERGFEREGAYYLLILRLMPGLPFFLVNWLMALTPIRPRAFAAVSWVGVLPLTFLYAGVGTELASMRSPADVLSPSVIASLAALAVVPLLIRKLIQWGMRNAEEEGARKGR